MKKLIIILLIVCSNTILRSQISIGELRMDQFLPVSTYKTAAPCVPSTSSIGCNATSSFNITATGYVGSNPTSGSSGCNPCCYAGADLDCDGVQDVPFSVENSKWYQYCNSTSAAITITVDIDEPGSGSTCNLQGAVWVGSSLSSAMGCGNSQYQQFGSNVGGSADGFVFSSVTVPAGQCAYVMIDGYGGSTCASPSISIICPVALPITLFNFRVVNNTDRNIIYWSTASEINNDYFTLERSTDGNNFRSVAEIDGAGNSHKTLHYSYTDKTFNSAVNYYRLKQTDHDGSVSYSTIIVIDNSRFKELTLVKITNILGQEVSPDFEGIKLLYYSNGSVVKQAGN